MVRVAWGRASLNQEIRWVNHPRNQVKGGVAKLSSINAAEC